nr:6-phosphogluconolactonase [Microvirga makkahensis]
MTRVSERLAADLAAILRQAVGERGHASLAVPGGTTPREFLTALGRCDLPWPQITVMPTDERDVAPDDMRSNERMIRECLPLASDGYAPLRADGRPLEDAAMELGNRLAPLLPLDAVVVGMGADTHIASLFPGDPRLGRNERGALPPVVPSYPAGLEPRLSLAPSPLAAARWKALLISGDEKRSALTAALETKDPVAHPVCLLFESGASPRVYWAE